MSIFVKVLWIYIYCELAILFRNSFGNTVQCQQSRWIFWICSDLGMKTQKRCFPVFFKKVVLKNFAKVKKITGTVVLFWQIFKSIRCNLIERGTKVLVSCEFREIVKSIFLFCRTNPCNFPSVVLVVYVEYLPGHYSGAFL